MSSKSIYSFEITNTTLSAIFDVEYSYIDAPPEAYDWSILESIPMGFDHDYPFYSTKNRQYIIDNAVNEIIPRLRSKAKKKSHNVLVEYTAAIDQINRQIAFLLNRCQEQYDIEYMNEVRALRAVKKRLLTARDAW